MNPRDPERFRDLMTMPIEGVMLMRELRDTMDCPCCEGAGVHVQPVDFFGITMLSIHACSTCDATGRLFCASMN